jgi:hypothetical protein
MFEDLSSVEDDDGGPPVGPALMLAAPCGKRELIVFEQMHRFGVRDFPGSHQIIFTSEDPETGEQTWDPPKSPGFYRDDLHWRKIMSWPVIPEIAEAVAFQANAEAALAAAWWDRLALARQADLDERPAAAAAVARSVVR